MQYAERMVSECRGRLRTDGERLMQQNAIGDVGRTLLLYVILLGDSWQDEVALTRVPAVFIKSLRRCIQKATLNSQAILSMS